jgi:hypothetical protein
MRYKFLWVIVLSFMVLATLKGALAFDKTMWWGYSYDGAHSAHISGTNRIAAFKVNVSITGDSDVQPIVADINGDSQNEIIYINNNFLYVYNMTGGVLASVYNTDLAEHQPSVYTSPACSTNRAVYIMGVSNTVYVYCYDGGVFKQRYNQTTQGNASGTINGISMVTYGADIYGLFLSKTVGGGFGGYDYFMERCNFLSNSISCQYHDITDMGYIDTQTNKNMPYGFFNADNKPDFWYINYPGTKLGVCDINFNCTNVTLGSLTANFDMIVLQQTIGGYDLIANRLTTSDVKALDYSGATILQYFGDGVGNSIFGIKGMTQEGIDGRVCYHYCDWDTNYYINCRQLDGSFDVQQSLGGSCDIGSFYYTAQFIESVDVDGDGDYDLLLSNQVNYTSNNPHICYNLGSTFDCQPFSNNPSKYFYAVDIDKDSKLDIIDYKPASNSLKWYLTSTVPGGGGALPTISITNTQQDVCGQTLSVSWDTDISSDTHLLYKKAGGAWVTAHKDEETKTHFIQIFGLDQNTYYEFEVESCYHGNNCTIQGGYSIVTGLSTDICGGQCAYPCIFYDDFEYFLPISTKGWYMTPTIYSDFAPDSGVICRNSSSGTWGTQTLRHDTPSSTLYQIYTHQFKFKITNTSIDTFAVRFYDSTDMTLYNIADVGISTNPFNGTHGNLFVMQTNPITGVEYSTTFGDPIYISVGSWHTLQVITYFDPLSRKFFNYTANSTQSIKPHTVGVVLDNSQAWFNVPFFQDKPSTDSIRLEDFVFDYWSDGDLCLDDVTAYVGTTFNASDLYQYVETLPVELIKGCFNIKTGVYQCLVSGCQDCCEAYKGSFRVKDLGCVMGKSVDSWLDDMAKWVLGHIFGFIILIMMVIILLPVLLKLYEVFGRRG